MIPDIPVQPVPDWLAAANHPWADPPPIRDLVARSVYYPGCLFDFEPIKYLAGKFHSFIYVDYGVRRYTVTKELEHLTTYDGRPENLNPFRGYRPIRRWRWPPPYRNVADILGVNEWTPQGLLPADGNPEDQADRIQAPFAVWYVFRRSNDLGPDHGPERFSLLYIGADGVASFQALFHGNQTCPAVVAVIQAPVGFGGNYTNFEDPHAIFARSVLENPAGVPEYLLFGGDHGQQSGEACWPRYRAPVCFLGKRLRLWRCAEPAEPERHGGQAVP